MRKPTEKQKRFVQNKLTGMSSRQAAIRAGYSKATAKNANEHIGEHWGTQTYSNKLGQLLEDNGVTDNVIAKKLEEGLEATNLNGKDAIEHIDYKTRLDYIKYASELKGHKPNDKLDINLSGSLFKNARKNIDGEDDNSDNKALEE